MGEARPFIPGKVVRQVTDEGAFLPHQEYLACRDPLTWSRLPAEAEIMDYIEQAGPLADAIKAAGEPHVFPAVTQARRAANEPAMPAGFHGTWRDKARNCGID